MLQELLTRNWYQQTQRILRQASPEAARMVNMVGVREALEGSACPMHSPPFQELNNKFQIS